MESKVVTWKGIDLFISGKDGRVSAWTDRLEKMNFGNLREAFKAISKKAQPETSLWDEIKEAVKTCKNKSRHYHSTYLGDDDRGIDNEMRLDLYYDGIHDFLKERKCLYMVYPTYYNCKDEVIA